MSPLLVLAICGTRWDPVFRWPILFSPILASIAELIIVWAWHTPRMHHAARHTALGLIAEQGTFLFCGLWLWLSAFGGDVQHNPGRAAAGVIGLLLTSMHMTLLGALLLFATRPLFHHEMAPAHLSAQTDQQLGGAIMLVVGGAAYLAGGLWLMFGILRDPVLHSKASLR